MNISEIKSLIQATDVCGHVALLKGKHGLGKSDIVRTYATENNLHCEILITSLMDESDLMGLPGKTEINGLLATTWAMPDWFARIMDAHSKGQRSVLFLDELNRASTQILNVSLQLILDKRLHSHILPPGTLIVAAINPDDEDYTVNSLDPAVLDRMVICDIEPDSRAWLSWAKANNLNEKVIEFITKSPKHLHSTPKDGGKGSSPRSWTRLATYLDKLEHTNTDIMTYYIKGTIGEHLAAEFLLFYNNYTKQLSVDDVIDHYTKSAKRIKDFDKQVASMTKLIDKIESVQKLELAEALTKKFESTTDTPTLMSYLTYLHALPAEVLAGYLKQLKTNKQAFDQLAELDKEVTNKALFRKLVTTN